MASQTLYLSAIELLSNPELVEASQKELKTRLAGKEIEPPMYDSFEVLTTNPSAFWDGTWLNNKIDLVRRNEV